LNRFYPCRKFVAKARIGSRVKKTRDAPRTPFSRALPDAAFLETIKVEFVTKRILQPLRFGSYGLIF
jgi:hypothetical protein